MNDLIHLAYRAVLDPKSWAQTVERLRLELGGSSAFLHSTDSLEVYSAQFSVSDELEYRAACQRYGNPWTDGWVAMESPQGQVFTGDSLVSPTTLRRSEIYNAFFRTHDIDNTIFVPLFSRAVWPYAKTIIGVNRTAREGRFLGTERNLLRALVPHFQRALQLSRALASRDSGYTYEAALPDIVNRLRDGVFLLDGIGRVVFANRVAERLMGPGGPLTLRGNRLSATLPRATPELHTLVNQVIGTAMGAEADFGGAVAIRNMNGTVRAFLTAAPLRTAQGADPADRSSVCAVVFVREPRASAPVFTETLRGLFGLSAGEARLASELAAGKSLADIAGSGRGRKSTLRSQLLGIFAKTGTHRQAELVRLLLSVPEGQTEPPPKGQD